MLVLLTTLTKTPCTSNPHISFARLTLSISYMFIPNRSMSHVPPSLPLSLPHSLAPPLPSLTSFLPLSLTHSLPSFLPLIIHPSICLSMLGSGGSMQGMLGIPNQGNYCPHTLSTHPINPPYQPTLLSTLLSTHPIDTPYHHARNPQPK